MKIIRTKLWASSSYVIKINNSEEIRNALMHVIVKLTYCICKANVL